MLYNHNANIKNIKMLTNAKFNAFNRFHACKLYLFLLRRILVRF